MKDFKKASRLEEVAAQATLQPLRPGDPRYVDLARGQSTKDLRKLRLDLEDQNANDARYARIAFSGHRGCGKTTLLYRLEEEIKPRFPPGAGREPAT